MLTTARMGEEGCCDVEWPHDSRCGCISVCGSRQQLLTWLSGYGSVQFEAPNSAGLMAFSLSIAFSAIEILFHRITVTSITPARRNSKSFLQRLALDRLNPTSGPVNWRGESLFHGHDKTPKRGGSFFIGPDKIPRRWAARPGLRFLSVVLYDALLLFDTPVYFLFLTFVVLVYWRLPWRKQNWMLLAASHVFYAWWDWRFLGLMLLSTTLDYFIGFRIADADSKRRKTFLVISLVLNFTFLGVFKYFNFFVDSLLSAAATMGIHDLPAPLIRVLLPPGVSFYTFQEVAYIVDVYGGKQEPSRSFVDYALFVSLFPHLIAGPIQPPRHLLSQVQHPRRFVPAQCFDGLMLRVFGLFRKCVIADNCGVLANLSFSGGLGHGFFPTVIGAVAFAFQIYCDFSGYTDLARGSAKLLGFRFIVNFRRPYLAATLQDFWRRWHISLSNWMRDYLYIPLGGNQKGHVRTYLNLIITMLLGGLWHGANWTFVVWGALHGLGLAVERFLAESLQRIPTLLAVAASRFMTMTVMGIGWIFFRATTVGQAFSMICDLGGFTWNPRFFPILITVAALGSVVIAIDLALEQNDDEYLLQSRPVFGPALAAFLLLVTSLFGALSSNAFIYFQF